MSTDVIVWCHRKDLFCELSPPPPKNKNKTETHRQPNGHSLLKRPHNKDAIFKGCAHAPLFERTIKRPLVAKAGGQPSCVANVIDNLLYIFFSLKTLLSVHVFNTTIPVWSNESFSYYLPYRQLWLRDVRFTFRSECYPDGFWFNFIVCDSDYIMQTNLWVAIRNIHWICILTDEMSMWPFSQTYWYNPYAIYGGIFTIETENNTKTPRTSQCIHIWRAQQVTT